jgi:hypothetical protein
MCFIKICVIKDIFKKNVGISWYNIEVIFLNSILLRGGKHEKFI